MESQQVESVLDFLLSTGGEIPECGEVVMGLHNGQVDRVNKTNHKSHHDNGLSGMEWWNGIVEGNTGITSYPSLGHFS